MAHSARHSSSENALSDESISPKTSKTLSGLHSPAAAAPPSSARVTK